MEAGADVNIQNGMGGTALSFAAMFNKVGLVKLLLENGAEKSLKDNQGITALQQAERQGFQEIIDLLK